MKKNKPKSHFGKIAKQYALGRPKFSNNIFKCLLKKFSPPSKILDIGCGTGIATRQLFNYGFKATGVDADSQMIAVARIQSENHKIKYLNYNAARIPFPDNSYPIVTAFSSFHWFCDDNSIKEIKRLLTKNGVFFIVNINEKGLLQHEIRNILLPFLKASEKKWQKQGYDPIHLLKLHGFKCIEETVLYENKQLSISEAYRFAQSINIFGGIPDYKKKTALVVLKKHLQLVNKKHIKRSIEIKIISALNN